MREIKFRGKTKSGDWLVGSYHKIIGSSTLIDNDYYRNPVEKIVDLDHHWILVSRSPDFSGWDIENTFQPYQVVKDSIGQYTGLKDKNGVEIYEGDILKLHEDWRGKGEIPQYVFWGDGCWMFQGTAHYTHKDRMSEFSIDKMEVIGNIHENENLLK